MGYPVKYRTAAARQMRAGSQTPSPGRSGTVLSFPERRMGGFSGGLSEAAKAKRKKGASQKSILNRPRSKTPTSAPRGLVYTPRPTQPFGLAGRVALRNKALGAIGGGLRIRSMLLRGIASWLLAHLVDVARDRLRIQNPGNSHHPGWTIVGRWGVLPYVSGLTNNHTIGSTIRHLRYPGTSPGGDPWSGVPFSWAEFDGVKGPLSGIDYFDFLQVGRGNQGTGPDPDVYYGGIQPIHDFPGEKNPWAPAYNPSWNRQPGRWPDAMPKQIPGLGPWIDPFSQPVGGYQPSPMNLPWAVIPHLRPNPHRSPSEQTQRGPVRVRHDIQLTPDPMTWPDLIHKPRDKPKPAPGPDAGGPYQPMIKTRFEPKLRQRSKVRERDKKPGKGRKEIKHKGTAAFAKILLAAVNGVSEFSDFLRALYKALPKHRQKRNALVIDQWKAVYRYFPELDLEHAVRSVIRDQVEDFIFGKMGKISGKAAHKRGGLYDPAGRASRRLSEDTGFGINKDVDVILDTIFGKDT